MRCMRPSIPSTFATRSPSAARAGCWRSITNKPPPAEAARPAVTTPRPTTASLSPQSNKQRDLMSQFRQKQPWRDSGCAIAAALLVLALLAAPALAVTQLQRGTDAPEVSLKDQNGADISNAKLRGHTIVLIFGERSEE